VVPACEGMETAYSAGWINDAIGKMVTLGSSFLLFGARFLKCRYDFEK